MNRIGKLLGMIFIFGIVFFIVCDEKGYKIEWQNNHMVFNKIEKKSDLKTGNSNNIAQLQSRYVYKNSNIIRINPVFKDVEALRKSDGIDNEYLARLEQEKNNQEKVYTGPSILAVDDNDSIFSMFQGVEPEIDTGTSKTTHNKRDRQGIKQNSGTKNTTVKPNINTGNGTTGRDLNNKTQKEKVVYYTVEKYEYEIHPLTLSKGKSNPVITYEVEKYKLNSPITPNIKKSQPIEHKIIYKNSCRIRIYSGFKNPLNLRNSAGIDEDYLNRQEDSKITIIPLKEKDTISSVREDSINNDESRDVPYDTGNLNNSVDENYVNTELTGESEKQLTGKSTKINTNTSIQEKENTEKYAINPETQNLGDKLIIESKLNKVETGNNSKNITFKVEKYKLDIHRLDIKKSAKIQNITENNSNQENKENIDISDISSYSDISEETLVKIEKYEFKKHKLGLKKGKRINYVPKIENNKEIDLGNGLSDPMFESLLENDEIDIDTLESENDEFLQKVFEKTKDRNIMNLIVENYLNEYQFVKAKRFIENLPEMYTAELKPSLNLRVAFNSFALTSKTTNESLTSLVQDYASKNEISEEDKNRYLGIIALMDRNYDKFFEIANNFTSEQYKAFASKLQGYKDQISKQMGMPEYYFDTLVSLELFNQGLFQPAKVLALYSLQQNANYILPYQILAYANFLTNSRDTSVEYLKKLVDLDPNNAEKYHFLMGVAYYRNEQYEQSVVMLSMIKDEVLRLDAQRYLINDYLKLNQRSKLISTWNKLLGFDDLVASDFYTYFYEAFFHPYAEGQQFKIYSADTELANKMIRVCSITLPEEERAVCTYGAIGRNIALGQFNGMEQYLLNLTSEYPQGYLYQALGEYYVKQGDYDKAKLYLLKAVSLAQNKSEKNQIKKLLEDTM